MASWDTPDKSDERNGLLPPSDKTNEQQAEQGGLVEPEHVDALRALLTGDVLGFERRTARLPNGSAGGFGVLAYAAFCEAVSDRFGDGRAPSGEIVRFIADIRSETFDTSLDPILVEALIRAALAGDSHHLRSDSESIATMTSFLLVALTANERYAGSALDEFLSRAQSGALHLQG